MLVVLGAWLMDAYIDYIVNTLPAICVKSRRLYFLLIFLLFTLMDKLSLLSYPAPSINLAWVVEVFGSHLTPLSAHQKSLFLSISCPVRRYHSNHAHSTWCIRLSLSAWLCICVTWRCKMISSWSVKCVRQSDWSGASPDLSVYPSVCCFAPCFWEGCSFLRRIFI